MNEKMSMNEFIRKCVWEGGTLYDGFQYGLSPDDLDDQCAFFKEMISHAHKAFLEFKKSCSYLKEAYGNFEEIANREDK